MYDFIVVGAGLFGATFAHEAITAGKTVLVIDKRNHIGGNAYTKTTNGIQIHIYGPHIFHTKSREVWQFVNQFATFNHFRYEPIANYNGKLYNLPFNMNTFYQMWGVKTPEEAERIINQQRAEIKGEIHNLEEQAISLIGRDIYEILVKGYTEKQWGRACTELPPFIIRRLPVRMSFNNNYYDDPFQGIPTGGYTRMIKNMLEGADVELNVDYLSNREKYSAGAKRIVYTGPIDAFYRYKYGKLEYRSLHFETETVKTRNFQGVAGMNFTDVNVPYTRIVEHKYFEMDETVSESTVITKEYPLEWKEGEEPYYPVNDKINQELYKKYKSLSEKEDKVLFGGRLAEYRYYNMDQVMESARGLARSVLDKNGL